MSKTRTTYLIIALSLLTFVAATAFLKNATREDINISISDNDDELRISASFPNAKSGEIHSYLRNKLNLSDLSDLKHLEIKRYQTPDGLMSFNIKSRDGYVKMLLNKNVNSREAYDKMKEAGEGLKEVLAH